MLYPRENIRPNVAAAIFSIIAMVLSGFSAVTAFRAFGQTSDASLYEKLARRPDIIATILTEYGKKNDADGTFRTNAEAKALTNVLLKSPMKIGNMTHHTNIVEFMDYRCTYCKASLKAIDKALAYNSNASVVVRQLPILGDLSKIIARYSLAAQEQGKFPALHKVFLENNVQTEKQAIALMERNGINVKKAIGFVHSKKCDALVAADAALAQRLNLHATPVFIIDGNVTQGWNEPLVTKALLKLQ